MLSLHRTLEDLPRRSGGISLTNSTGTESRVFNDNLQHTHRALLEYGLVPLSDVSTPTNSCQTKTARGIVVLAEKDQVQLGTDIGPIQVRSLELILLKAAQFFQIEIVFFSTRKVPYTYKPSGNARYSVALLSIKDRIISASQLVALGRSKTRPMFWVGKQPQPPPPPPPLPGAGFDMRSLIPKDFRPSEDTFQWNVPVAPITMQSSIENGATSPDDRFKLLGHENLKFWFSRLLAPGGGRASATGNHPLWASLLEATMTSGY
ncbi:hypothetical protein B0O80DRAFT_521823 [Mortierella sp. GBAus27b]|nr:hypothetical protein B0O80DRAFT_521823 [Mortierella sp. GBAus27b]